MPRRVEDLGSRVEELETEIERLLDEYVEVRQRLDFVESRIGPANVHADGHDRAVSDAQLEAVVGNVASGGATDEEASPEDVDQAVEEVDDDGARSGDDPGGSGDDPGGSGDESTGMDDIIIA